MADDEFKLHQLDGPSEGEGPQTQVPEDNPLVHGPAHFYDPKSQPSPNEVAELEQLEAEKASKPKPKPKASKASTKKDEE